jgi:hypothetical protein
MYTILRSSNVLIPIYIKGFFTNEALQELQNNHANLNGISQRYLRKRAELIYFFDLLLMENYSQL